MHDDDCASRALWSGSSRLDEADGLQLKLKEKQNCIKMEGT